MSNTSALFNENFEKERKYEVLGGVQYMAPPPSTAHSQSSGNSYSIFRNYFKGTKCRVFIEHNLFLSEKDHLIPDVMVVCNAEIIQFDGIYGTPNLIVEVLSPSTSVRDRGYKKDLYEKHKVVEYWLIDPKNRIVSVYLLVDDKYKLDNEYYIPEEWELKRMTDVEKEKVQYTFKTHLSEDLIIDIRDVFENV
ncbi:MAG: Uma2 family endonuclease [Defluviitaleaceae bacterium]|nr:Uma2 family endonuclease [Defluviitaleaceae bacterium]